jgi:hypothetical protein
LVTKNNNSVELRASVSAAIVQGFGQHFAGEARDRAHHYRTERIENKL